MSKHRATRAPRHRATGGARHGRAAALVGVLASTAVVAVVGAGLLPGDEEPARAVDTQGTSAGSEPRSRPAVGAGRTPDAAPRATPEATRDRSRAPASGKVPAEKRPADPAADTALPARSGEGRRVVFSEGRQRVWLVADGSEVVRTYPVSGSVYDNLEPGTYSVYSRSEDAVGIDDSGTMKYFVRFTTGDQGAAIGFHDIPVHDGQPVQTLRQLGTPLSHGCIRQKREDAIALWDFAPVGTTVVVTP